MKNSNSNDGSSYVYTGNNSGAIRASNEWGAQYTFGVAGWNYNDDIRTAGVFGAQYSAVYWGALGYKNSAGSTYGGYFTSSTTGGGKFSSYSGPVEGIGVGAWGDLMGADIHGGVYGLYAEGGHFAIYSKGPVFSDQPAVHLQDVGEAARAVTYASASTDATVMSSGQGRMVNGHCSVSYDDTFKKVTSRQVPIIVTVTPTGPSRGIYLSSSDHDGFSVTENDGGESQVSFYYIAIGRRAGYENPELPEDVLSGEFDRMMSEGLHNDMDTTTDGKGLHVENGTLYQGHSISARHQERLK